MSWREIFWCAFMGISLSYLIYMYFERTDNNTIKTHCLTMERIAFVDSKEFNYKKCVEHER